MSQSLDFADFTDIYTQIKSFRSHPVPLIPYLQDLTSDS